MNDETDHSYFKCQLMSATDKARCLLFINHPEIDQMWVPKSLSDWHKMPGADGVGVIVIESWFAKQEGLE